MGTSVVVLPGECCWGGEWYLTGPSVGLLWENGVGYLPILGLVMLLSCGLGACAESPWWMGGILRGVLLLDGGLSSSEISNCCSSSPGTLSYWDALEPRSEPGIKSLECGLLWSTAPSSVLEGAWAAAARTSSSFVLEGLTQRGVMSFCSEEVALELWLAVAWLLGCGTGVGAEIGGVEIECLCCSLGISPDPLERSALWRIILSRESLRILLGGRLSGWCFGTGLGSLGVLAGSVWLWPLATWFTAGGSCPRGFLGNSSSLPVAWRQKYY